MARVKQETSKLQWQAMTPRERAALCAEKIMGWQCNGEILCWSPTTCPKDCTRVIEAMRAKGYVVRLENGLDGTWEATFYKPNATAYSSSDKNYAAANTMPEAVALAALRAVGVEV